MKVCAGPQTLKGPKQVQRIYLYLEEFKKLEGKGENEKSDLELPGTVV